MTRPNEATLAQIDASDPSASTWLSANAGSGKTRVLTDRVAKLLLGGVEPQRILCLTYTKAAAAEMQNRLFQRLGSWAMLDDEPLRAALQDLGVQKSADLDRARTLFARAIDTPGGLKIQTIHSFCSALLRQFPLEAGVTPQFRELDEQGQTKLIETVLDRMAIESADRLQSVSRQFTGESLVELAKEVIRKRESYSDLSRREVFRDLGAQDLETEATVISAALSSEDIAFLNSLSGIFAQSSKTMDLTTGEILRGLPAMSPRSAFWLLKSKLLFSSGLRAGQPSDKIPTKELRDGSFRDYLMRFSDIQSRIAEANDKLIKLNAAEKTWVLREFAQALLPAYRDEKDVLGVLDFDDLIQRARVLLTDGSYAWVLYRLDGGLDHILVDEAQDTSPAQWQVIEALAAEMTAGQGARDDVERTLFVVGDKKQSIYSFQGADANEFDRMSDSFASQLDGATPLRSRELLFSFRSSPAILEAVDSVFQDAPGLGSATEHRAFHEALPGRVDLWQIEPFPDSEENDLWYAPVDRLAANSPRAMLAEKVASAIKDMIENGSIPAENGSFRAIQPRDILILVQSRSDLFHALIRSCKSIGVPIAGADRLRISAELAVRDLLALLSVVALPEDDLSLAASLRSPLFGISEQQLFDLAHGRKGYLWTALRASQELRPVYDQISELRSRADFIRPYEMIDSILTQMGGRQKLIARLGPEAEDGINELLNQALNYEKQDVPSLTGFLTHAQTDDLEIKRQSDMSGNQVRIMTVHGAKGLESPVVFLPDTIRARGSKEGPVIFGESDTPYWRTRAGQDPINISNAKEQAAKAQREESQRLLYVAMTRAAHWLVVGGAAQKNTPARNWHADVQRGMETLQASLIDENGIGFFRHQRGVWKAAETDEKAKLETKNKADFGDLHALPPAARNIEMPLSPSALGGAKVISGERNADDSDAAQKRGSQVHWLLENMPKASFGDDAIIDKLTAPGPIQASAGEVVELIGEAQGVISAASDLFTQDTLAEVDVFGFSDTLGKHVRGTIDRLVVQDSRILCVDFKTNKTIPVAPDDVPEGILRQMGGYLEILESIWPSHEVLLEILWTAGPVRMHLEHGIVREALARSTTS